jgi:hypothetical protein
MKSQMTDKITKETEHYSKKTDENYKMTEQCSKITEHCSKMADENHKMTEH